MIRNKFQKNTIINFKPTEECQNAGMPGMPECQNARRMPECQIAKDCRKADSLFRKKSAAAVKKKNHLTPDNDDCEMMLHGYYYLMQLIIKKYIYI